MKLWPEKYNRTNHPNFWRDISIVLIIKIILLSSIFYFFFRDPIEDHISRQDIYQHLFTTGSS